MFKKIKENIIKQIIYKGIIAYSNVLLENLEKKTLKIIIYLLLGII